MSGVLPHEHYMRRAIELGKQNPRLPFGALIVDRVTGEILAEGWNRTEINPICHGEIDAINRLAQARPTIDGTQLVLYTTARVLSHVPGCHPLVRHRNGGLRKLDPFSPEPRMVAN